MAPPSGFPQQAAPQPTPQQQAQAADIAHHSALGKVASTLFGKEVQYKVDPNSGAVVPVKVQRTPGEFMRSLVAGVLMGAAVGGAAGFQQPQGGFLGGAAQGGAAVLGDERAWDEQNRERVRQSFKDAQDIQQKQRQMSVEEQRLAEEKSQHAATLEHWNLENLARAHEADYRDREDLLQENRQDADIQKWAAENGAYLAPTIKNNGVPGNGPDLMKAMVANPAAFNAPDGMSRLITKHYSFDGLDHDSKNGWTEDGKPVDWSKHMTWNVYYVPQTTKGKPISMSAADWSSLYNVKFPKGTDPDQMFNVDAIKPLISVATTNRKQDREDASQAFKEEHGALNATFNDASKTITQLNNTKSSLVRRGFAEDGPEVKDVEQQIQAATKRKDDALAAMHPHVRQRVTKQQPSQPAPAKPSQPTPKPSANAKPAGATMRVPGSDGKLHWSDGKQDLGVAQ